MTSTERGGEEWGKTCPSVFAFPSGRWGMCMYACARAWLLNPFWGSRMLGFSGAASLRYLILVFLMVSWPPSSVFTWRQCSCWSHATMQTKWWLPGAKGKALGTLWGAAVLQGYFMDLMPYPLFTALLTKITSSTSVCLQKDLRKGSLWSNIKSVRKDWL